MRSLRSILGTGCATALTLFGWLRWHSPLSLGLLIVATTLLALALGAPRAFAPIQSAFDHFGRALTAVLTILVLGLVFALIFIPGRLVLTLLRRDPLHRRPDPARSTYWEPLPPASAVDRFRRQF